MQPQSHKWGNTMMDFQKYPNVSTVYVCVCVKVDNSFNTSYNVIFSDTHLIVFYDISVLFMRAGIFHVITFI